jgi:hypothetical protein
MIQGIYIFAIHFLAIDVLKAFIRRVCRQDEPAKGN